MHKFKVLRTFGYHCRAVNGSDSCVAPPHACSWHHHMTFLSSNPAVPTSSQHLLTLFFSESRKGIVLGNQQRALTRLGRPVLVATSLVLGFAGLLAPGAFPASPFRRRRLGRQG